MKPPHRYSLRTRVLMAALTGVAGWFAALAIIILATAISQIGGQS